MMIRVSWRISESAKIKWCGEKSFEFEQGSVEFLTLTGIISQEQLWANMWLFLAEHTEMIKTQQNIQKAEYKLPVREP